MKRDAYSMMLKANDRFCNANSRHIPITHKSSHVEITNEDNAITFFDISDYFSLLIHSTKPNS
jgi:hypothetical protein